MRLKGQYFYTIREDIKDEEMFISNSPDTTLEATVKVYEW